LPTLAWPAALLLAAAGEIVDRVSFYALLEPIRPEAMLVAAAGAWSRRARR
jgi:hypothetical protein